MRLNKIIIIIIIINKKIELAQYQRFEQLKQGPLRNLAFIIIIILIENLAFIIIILNPKFQSIIQITILAHK